MSRISWRWNRNNRAPGSNGRFDPQEGAGGAQIVQAAHDWIGTPYVWGGGGPQGPSGGGLDGPGLTSASVFAASSGSVTLPRTAEQQWESGAEVSMSKVAPAIWCSVRSGRAAPGWSESIPAMDE